MENPAIPITPASIDGYERARQAARLPIRVTARTAPHSICSSWIHDLGTEEIEILKLSRQAGRIRTRRTSVHVALTDGRDERQGIPQLDEGRSRPFEGYAAILGDRTLD